MSTTKWIPGVTMIRGPGGQTCEFIQAVPDGQEILEARGWRAADPPVDAPAEKRELVLAPGWKNREAEARTFNWRCDAKIDSGRCRAFAPFKKDDGKGESFCEEHADLRHAFAPPAPAKTRHEPWCGLPYLDNRVPCGTPEHLVRGGRFASGEPLQPVYCSVTCRDDAARAKPAEPQPAPAEKAKREWKAPREMVGGVFDGHLAAVTMADTTSAQMFGTHRALLCNLAREKPPARVFPETHYNATSTDAHGKLSRLVESGARAGALVDASTWETRFAAGLRGTK